MKCEMIMEVCPGAARVFKNDREEEFVSLRVQRNMEGKVCICICYSEDEGGSVQVRIDEVERAYWPVYSCQEAHNGELIDGNEEPTIYEECEDEIELGGNRMAHAKLEDRRVTLTVREERDGV